jgi:hypothetical protein
MELVIFNMPFHTEVSPVASSDDFGKWLHFKFALFMHNSVVKIFTQTQ